MIVCFLTVDETLCSHMTALVTQEVAVAGETSNELPGIHVE